LAKEELETINVGIGQDKKELNIGTLITTSKRRNLVSLLCEYFDVFAWYYVDIHGLNTNIVLHKMPLNE
jgi:hypothetical protein